MKFHIVFNFLAVALVLSLYITFRIEIMVTGNERFQGYKFVSACLFIALSKSMTIPIRVYISWNLY
jgi:hypothetical protein